MSDFNLKIKQIGSKVLTGCNYRLGIFGSRVVGRSSKMSDLDVAVLGNGKVPGHILEKLREAFEYSDLPYRVDVVDLASTSNSFRQQVEKEVVWL